MPKKQRLCSKHQLCVIKLVNQSLDLINFDNQVSIISDVRLRYGVKKTHVTSNKLDVEFCQFAP